MATRWTIIAHKVQLPRSLGRVWTCFGRGVMSQSGHGQQLAFFAPTITKGTGYHEVPQHPALSFPQAKSLRLTHLCVTMMLFPLTRATVKKELGAFQQHTGCPTGER